MVYVYLYYVYIYGSMPSSGGSEVLRGRSRSYHALFLPPRSLIPSLFLTSLTT